MQVVVFPDGELLGPVLGPPMKVQVAVSGASKGAKLALEGFELFMDSFLVMLQLRENEKLFAASITRKRLVTDMNLLDVNVQVVLVFETLSTLLTHQNGPAVVLLIVKIKITPKFEHFVTFITEKRGLSIVMDLVLMTFQFVRALIRLVTLLAGKSI